MIPRTSTFACVATFLGISAPAQSHEGGNVEAVLDRQQKRYAAQLEACVAALGGAKRGIYMPLLTGWRDW